MTVQGIRRGEDHAHAKLTEDQVRHLRKSCAPGSHGRGFSAFARRYGVDQSTIRDAVHGITWTHLAPAGAEIIAGNHRKKSRLLK
ncbi:hypothetical protein UFOVP4_45 [uncultured Caudovirales phage]|uniref:Uncharacterized protein n=1 Tax=uncultured Caudovirales phage TaxID=2100421 RepID=A0A6J5T9K2_9CAUD|nr:hypothetical protein UFOVP4_45 [uncultured Caudovirales phage]CAB4241251.1 hypothetical protein UFOVP64_15 [uncultured Caudovirales phage]CAB5078988.1 hypothetical protein UFOVP145_29 [uncultured Caudovirales phage]